MKRCSLSSQEGHIHLPSACSALRIRCRRKKSPGTMAVPCLANDFVPVEAGNE